MKLHRLFFVLMITLLLISTVACDRIASVAPVVVPLATKAGAVNFPVGTQANPTDIANLVNTQVVGIQKDAGTVVATDGAAATAAPTVTATPAPTLAATAAPTATPAPSATPVTAGGTYALAHGEWAICIARRFDLDLNAFFPINHIDMHTNYLPTGFVLQIPSGTHWNSAYGPRYWHAHPGTYVAMPNDTVNSVACFFGDVSPQQIIDANGLGSNNNLYPGQKLSIP